MALDGESYFGRRKRKIKFAKRFETLEVTFDPETNGTIEIGGIIIQVVDGVPVNPVI
jgi:hypothetical protein